jgi:Cu-Zn family superoxide dismutase
MPTPVHSRHVFCLFVLLTSFAVAPPYGPAAAQVQPGQPRTVVYELADSTHGNPEGVAFDPRSGAFFVGATADGTIYRGTLDNPILTPYIPGGELNAVGLKVWQGKLYVAGGFFGDVRVYDIDSRMLVASFETGGGGMLNDLVVTVRGDVFVTDSFRPTLWRITAEQVAAGTGVPTAIPMAPEIEYGDGPFAFNLNGIVALNDGMRLVVVNSYDGRLYRIDLDDSAPYGREIREIAVEPLFGDGLLIDGGRLVVVTFDQPGLAIVQLNGDATAGDVIERVSDPSFREPSTVARAHNYYLVVNADFSTSTTPFTVTAITRNSQGQE